jgi:TolB-like protein
MKTKKLLILIIFALFSTASFGTASGGQVVTDEARAWAKQALEQEKSLKAPVAPNAVGVLYFPNRTRQPDLDPLQKGIAVMLITDLSKVKGLTVVERIRLQALVEEMKLGASGLVDQKNTSDVGKLLGAHWLVGGNLLSGQASVLQIKSNVLDVPKGQISGQPDAEGMLDDLIRMEKDLVFETIKILKIEPTSQELVELKKPLTTNINALLDFSRCIDQSDRGNYQEAAGFCKAALAADPLFGLALTTLQELTSLGVTGAAVGTATTAAATGTTGAGVTVGATGAGVTVGATAAGTAAGATAGAVTAGVTAAGIGAGAATAAVAGETPKPVSPF